MNAKVKLLELIEDMPETDLAEVVDFIGYLKLKRDKSAFKDLALASESSLKFWENEIDDRVWNDV
jgi:hypothetical protein